jgi:hypothetical protein
MAKRKTNTQIVNGLVKQFNDNEMVFVSAILRQVVDEYVEHNKDADVELTLKTDPFFKHTLRLAERCKLYLDEAYGMI